MQKMGDCNIQLLYQGDYRAKFHQETNHLVCKDVGNHNLTFAPFLRPSAILVPPVDTRASMARNAD
jgi:hypothetical protein